jgi:hypothetical protein
MGRQWKRLKECPICSSQRCVETEWIVYCYRWTRAFNKKQLEATGLGIPKDLVLRRGLEGQSPSSDLTQQPSLRFKDEELNCPYENGL